MDSPKAKLVVEIPAAHRQSLKMIAAARGTTTATIIREFIHDFIAQADLDAERDWALSAVKSYEAGGKKSRPLSDLKDTLEM